MSYDFTLYRKTHENMSVEDVFALMEEDNHESELRFKDPARPARVQGVIAPSTRSLLEEIASRLPIVYDVGSHGEITLYIPYHYDGEDAKQLFAEINKYLVRLTADGNYVVFDPQHGELIDPVTNPISEDFYVKTTALFPEMLARNQQVSAPPAAWKKWLSTLLVIGMLGIIVGQYIWPSVFPSPLVWTLLVLNLAIQFSLRR